MLKIILSPYVNTGKTLYFLHKIVRGGTNRSFGIEVAKLAGLPEGVIARAKDLLQLLMQADIVTPKLGAAEIQNAKSAQMTFLTEVDNEVYNLIRNTNTDNITPLQALNLICELKSMVKG